MIAATLHETAARARRGLKLAERRELVAAGKLPGSSRYAHSVPLAVDLISRIEVREDGKINLNILKALGEAIDAAKVGGAEIWFDATGNAFLSFDFKDDATLFRLALDA